MRDTFQLLYPWCCGFVPLWIVRYPDLRDMTASWDVPMSVFVRIQTLLVERVHPHHGLDKWWDFRYSMPFISPLPLSLSLSFGVFLPLLSPTSFCCSLFVLYLTKADVAERLEQADANFPRIFRHCTWFLMVPIPPPCFTKAEGKGTRTTLSRQRKHHWILKYVSFVLQYIH